MPTDEERPRHPLDVRLSLLESHLAQAFDEISRLEQQESRLASRLDDHGAALSQLATALQSLVDRDLERSRTRAENGTILQQVMWIVVILMTTIIGLSLALSSWTTTRPSPLGWFSPSRIWPEAHSTQYPQEVLQR